VDSALRRHVRDESRDSSETLAAVLAALDELLPPATPEHAVWLR
jgi:hypothetical protein